jgi:hypothetical protein
LSNFATRELSYPSLTKMSPAGSKATSVGLRGRVNLVALFEEALHVVDRLVLAAEHHRDEPLRVELHHHVRPFVDHPEVVVLVEPDGVREGEAVRVLAPLLHVVALFVELEELRRLGAARRTDVAAARVDEEMFLRIDCHAFRFTDGVAGRHEGERHRVERNLRCGGFDSRLGGRCRLHFGAASAAAAASARSGLGRAATASRGLARLGRGSAAAACAALGVGGNAEHHRKNDHITFHGSLLLLRALQAVPDGPG